MTSACEMTVRPVVLGAFVKSKLEPSRNGVEWAEVDNWIADAVACAWQIGSDAYALTFANEDSEIELLMAGGSGAIRATRPFIEAMLGLAEHKGLSLRLEGRPGWRRFLPDWKCEEMKGGTVVLTKAV